MSDSKTDSSREVTPIRKKFKFKIRVQADHHEKDVPGNMTFADAANKWYTNIGKKSLETYFADLKSVNDYSSLDKFSFGDNVDKETYD